MSTWSPSPRRSLPVALWCCLLALIALAVPGLAGERRVPVQGARGALRAFTCRGAVAFPQLPNGPSRPASALPAFPSPTRRPAAKPDAGRIGAPSSQDPLQVKGLYSFNSTIFADRQLSSLAIAGDTIVGISSHYAVVSTDAGQTFRRTFINGLIPPDTSWDTSYPQVCYAPSIGCFIMAQHLSPRPDSGVPNGLRIAVATPEGAAQDSWTSWHWADTTSFSLPESPGNYPIVVTEPRLSVGANYLYVGLSVYEAKAEDPDEPEPISGQILARIPLAGLAQGANLSLLSLTTVDVAGSGLPGEVGTRAYWAGQRGQNGLRVYHWDENSDTIFWNDVATTPWNPPTPSFVVSETAPDPGRDWLDGLNLKRLYRHISGAALANGSLWLSWTAGADPGAGRPHSFAKLVRVDLNTLETAEVPISSDTFAVAFPVLASNPDGELAFAFYSGGGNVFPRLTVGMLTGNPQSFNLTTGDHGPRYTYWSRPSIQRAYPYSRLFIAQGYSLQGGEDQLLNADRKAVLFGRAGDIPDQYEPDDSGFAARPITTPQTHSFHVPGDVDWVYFDLKQSSRVTVSTAGDSTEDDTELFLYNESFTAINYDDDSGGSKYSRIETGTLPPGRYYVRVSEFGDNARIGSYFLRVELVSGFILSGTVTLNGAGFDSEVRLYSDATRTQQVASVNSDPKTGHWEYRAPSGGTVFVQPFRSGYTFSAGYLLQDIQSEIPGLDFTAQPVGPPEPPAPPTGLAGIPFSDTQVLLSFTDQASTETGFEVRRGLAANGPFTTVSPNAPEAPSGGPRFYLAGGLTAKKKYWFQVRALPQTGPNDGWVTVGPVKTLAAGDRLLIPRTVKVPKSGKAKVGQTKTLVVKVVNPFAFPVPVAVTQAPSAPFGLAPPGSVITLPAVSSGPLNLTFSFSPTTATPSTQTQQILLTLMFPGADVPVPITLQGSVK